MPGQCVAHVLWTVFSCAVGQPDCYVSTHRSSPPALPPADQPSTFTVVPVNFRILPREIGLTMKGYQNLSHTRWDADGGSRPRGEYQLGRLLRTTKWQSVSLDRPSDVRRCSFERPFMADAVEKVAVWLFQFVRKKIDLSDQPTNRSRTSRKGEKTTENRAGETVSDSFNSIGRLPPLTDRSESLHFRLASMLQTPLARPTQPLLPEPACRVDCQSVETRYALCTSVTPLTSSTETARSLVMRAV
ncbi:hypothetical protein LMG28614_06938 [Paraburkholderia ultramafica]|uniref:Uncharacterized protein n=1 Tax=Paraburkholderia ultramafica TaxID=1544867 RepID=A0A6S7BPZ1_9BURK|nr:hypothetical protein LMG28614_06938 [Paraburkholderia ultramafica]